MRKVDSDTERILARIRHLRPGEHVCALQENKRDEMLAAAAFIQGGLERGERCHYIADASRPEAIIATLRSQGVDADAARNSGMLTITDKRTYLRHGYFVPDEMIRFFAESYREAKSKYSGIRFGGDMTWLLGRGGGPSKLIEFEAKVNDFLHKNKSPALCQYSLPDFDAEVILNVLRTHPLVIHREFMAENPYYIPPREFLTKDPAPLQVDRYLSALRDHAKSKEELRQLSLELLHSQDEERRRIARELHDSTGQNLTGLVMNLASLKKAKPEIGVQARRNLSISLRLAKQASKEINNLSYLLHPPILEEFGLSGALRWYTRGFSRRSGIDVKLTMSPKLDRLPKEIEIAVFRIVQEGLTNVHRHSGSRRAHVYVGLKGQYLTIKLHDFGRGLHPFKGSQPVDTVGVGIASMRERVQQLGGELDFRSGSTGTILHGTIPVDRRAA
jgi:signal transduction histidine kinase